MRITAFVGSARKKHTYNATVQLLQKMKNLGTVEYEIVLLSDYNLKICTGCKLCLDKGEEFCPLKDDRDILIKKMEDSDGVLFASPNYSFHVSGHMKVFLDRLGYIFHRPRLFGKSSTSIVAQGIYGGNDILKYFNFIGNALGFNTVKGICLITREPISEKDQKKNDAKIEKLSKQIYYKILKKEFPVPSVFELMLFRLSRTSIRLMLDKSYRDYNYYTEKGWFVSDYFYEVKINPVKRLLGKIFDFLATKMK